MYNPCLITRHSEHLPTWTRACVRACVFCMSYLSISARGNLASRVAVFGSTKIANCVGVDNWLARTFAVMALRASVHAGRATACTRTCSCTSGERE